MIITVCSFKGGVGKSTTAMHLAAILSRSGKTILVDCDRNHSSLHWAGNRPEGMEPLPFRVEDAHGAMAAFQSSQFDHIVTDTEARTDNLSSLAKNSQLLILPTAPASLDLDGLVQTVEAIRQIESEEGKRIPFRTLLTIVSPPYGPKANGVQTALENAGIPTFNAFIKEYEAFRRAPLCGCLVSELKTREERNAPLAALCYEEVGVEIEQILADQGVLL